MRTLRAMICGTSLVAAILIGAAGDARAASTETSNTCSESADDPCTRSGSCEIQSAVWNQVVTIDRADRFDTMGWPGLCDMVHVGLVQGSCEPPGAQRDVTVPLSETSSAFVSEIVGPLACAGEPQPVPALGVVASVILACLLALACVRRGRLFTA